MPNKRLYAILGCPKSVFLLQTRHLQQCLYTNMKPNLSNVVIFILIEQKSYVIR